MENTDKKQKFIYRPYRKDPSTGKLIWAKNYGYKAWRIPISDLDRK